MPLPSRAAARKAVEDYMEEEIGERKQMKEAHQETLDIAEEHFPGAPHEHTGQLLQHASDQFNHLEIVSAQLKKTLQEGGRARASAGVGQIMENIQGEIELLKDRCKASKIPRTGTDLDEEETERLSELREIVKASPNNGLALFNQQGLAKELHDSISRQNLQIFSKLVGWGSEVAEAKQNAFLDVDSYLSYEFDKRMAGVLEPLQGSHAKVVEEFERTNSLRIAAVDQLSALQEEREEARRREETSAERYSNHVADLELQVQREKDLVQATKNRTTAELNIIRQQAEDKERAHAAIETDLMQKDQKLRQEMSQLRSELEALKRSSKRKAEDGETRGRVADRAVEDVDDESGLRHEYFVWNFSTIQQLDTKFVSQNMLKEWKTITDTMKRVARSGAISRIVATQSPILTIAHNAVRSRLPSDEAAAHRLWLSSFSSDIEMAFSFFGSQTIGPDQAILLPWMHAALNHAIGSLSNERITPGLVKKVLTILQGLAYVENVAHVWPQDHEWLPSLPVLLKNLTTWLKSRNMARNGIVHQLHQRVSSLILQDMQISSWISNSMLGTNTQLDSTNSNLDHGTILLADSVPDIFVIVRNRDTENETVCIFERGDVSAIEIGEHSEIQMVFRDDTEIANLQMRIRGMRIFGSMKWIFRYLSSEIRYT